MLMLTFPRFTGTSPPSSPRLAQPPTGLIIELFGESPSSVQNKTEMPRTEGAGSSIFSNQRGRYQIEESSPTPRYAFYTGLLYGILIRDA